MPALVGIIIISKMTDLATRAGAILELYIYAVIISSRHDPGVERRYYDVMDVFQDGARVARDDYFYTNLNPSGNFVSSG